MTNTTYVDLVKLSVKCNRPDLVQRVVNMTHQGDTLKWSDVEAKLNPTEQDVIAAWVHDNRMSYKETDVLDLVCISFFIGKGRRDKF